MKYKHFTTYRPQISTAIFFVQISKFPQNYSILSKKQIFSQRKHSKQNF